MTEVIVRNQAPFLDILRDDPGLYAHVARKFIDVVARSFGEDVVSSLVLVPATEAETKRRAEICIKWFRIMVGDCKFPVVKALDFLPVALRAELDGRSFEPPRAGGWTKPGDTIAMVPDGVSYTSPSPTK